jgi:hypothetical protein
LVDELVRIKMAEGPRRLRFSKYNFQCLINALTWSNGLCGERGTSGGLVGKGKGPWQKSVVIINFNEIFLGVFTYIQLFPTR